MHSTLEHHIVSVDVFGGRNELCGFMILVAMPGAGLRHESIIHRFK